ncbi:putative transposase [Pseudomonas sp. Ag1]|nr:putative transposase [Pseudomonas sp. Ag1]
MPIDNNQIENLIRPWALGRPNWLFAGSLHSVKRAAAIMSLIQSARINGHDPYAYLKDVLTRLPTQRANEIKRLLPISGRLPDQTSDSGGSLGGVGRDCRTF